MPQVWRSAATSPCKRKKLRNLPLPPRIPRGHSCRGPEQHINVTPPLDSLESHAKGTPPLDLGAVTAYYFKCCSGFWQLHPAKNAGAAQDRSFLIWAGACKAQWPEKGKSPRDFLSHRDLSRRTGYLEGRLSLTEGVGMGIIAWIVLGLVAGLLANLLIPGRRSQGLIVTCAIGILGALGGGWVATQLFHIHTLHGSFKCRPG